MLIICHGDDNDLQGATVNDISAVWVPPGCEAILYDNSSDSGWRAKFSEDQWTWPNFLNRAKNDQTSRITVRDAGSAGCGKSQFWISADDEAPLEQTVDLTFRNDSQCSAVLCGNLGECCRLPTGSYLNQRMFAQNPECPSIGMLRNISTTPGCSVKVYTYETDCKEPSLVRGFGQREDAAMVKDLTACPLHTRALEPSAVHFDVDDQIAHWDTPCSTIVISSMDVQLTSQQTEQQIPKAAEQASPDAAETFGGRASFCATSPGGDIELGSTSQRVEPPYFELLMGSTLALCTAAASENGYKYINFWSSDGRCRGLNICPYEQPSVTVYDTNCKTYTVIESNNPGFVLRADTTLEGCLGRCLRNSECVAAEWNPASTVESAGSCKLYDADCKEPTMVRTKPGIPCSLLPGFVAGRLHRRNLDLEREATNSLDTATKTKCICVGLNGEHDYYLVGELMFSLQSYQIEFFETQDMTDWNFAFSIDRYPNLYAPIY